MDGFRILRLVIGTLSAGSKNLKNENEKIVTLTKNIKVFQKSYNIIINCLLLLHERSSKSIKLPNQNKYGSPQTMDEIEKNYQGSYFLVVLVKTMYQMKIAASFLFSQQPHTFGNRKSLVDHYLLAGHLHQ